MKNGVLTQGKDKSSLEVRRADDFEIHADGTFTINQSTFVHGNINEFKKMAAVLYAEADGTTSEAVDEVAGIYSVIENRAKARDTKVIDQMKPGEGYGVAGAGDKEMNRINTEKGAEADAKRKAVFAGLIKGILSETDFSNGAFYWDGKDFEKGGGHDQRYSPGYKFTNKDHDLFGQKDNKKPGSNVFKFKNPKTPPVTKTWDYKYQSTNAIGKTTFSKLTDAYRNAQHLTKKADEFGVVPKK